MRTVPLDVDTFPLLEDLFGPDGAVGGCWCMWFRQRYVEYRANAGEPNRRALAALVARGEPVGLLAVTDAGSSVTGEAVGWVAVSPRLAHSRLATTKVAAPAPGEDLTHVWSVTCLFIRDTARGQGIGGHLVRAAVRHAVEQGARVVEAYPVDPVPGRRVPVGELQYGTVNLFTANGFVLVERRGTRRALVRHIVD